MTLLNDSNKKEYELTLISSTQPNEPLLFKSLNNIDNDHINFEVLFRGIFCNLRIIQINITFF